jgi:hypothetical protein
VALLPQAAATIATAAKADASRILVFTVVFSS